jgi:hypothetical protein
MKIKLYRILLNNSRTFFGKNVDQKLGCAAEKLPTLLVHPSQAKPSQAKPSQAKCVSSAYELSVLKRIHYDASAIVQGQLEATRIKTT